MSSPSSLRVNAEILAVGDPGPSRVEFTFEGDLATDYRWLMWTRDGLVSVALPPVGEQLVVPYSHPAEEPKR